VRRSRAQRPAFSPRVRLPPGGGRTGYSCAVGSTTATSKPV